MDVVIFTIACQGFESSTQRGFLSTCAVFVCGAVISFARFVDGGIVQDTVACFERIEWITDQPTGCLGSCVQRVRVARIGLGSTGCALDQRESTVWTTGCYFHLRRYPNAIHCRNWSPTYSKIHRVVRDRLQRVFSV